MLIFWDMVEVRFNNLATVLAVRIIVPLAFASFFLRQECCLFYCTKISARIIVPRFLPALLYQDFCQHYCTKTSASIIVPRFLPALLYQDLCLFRDFWTNQVQIGSVSSLPRQLSSQYCTALHGRVQMQ